MSTLSMAIPLRKIGQNLPWREFFPVKLNRKIIGLSADGIGSVKRASGINKKSRAGKFAMLIERMNLYDRFRAALENLS